MCDLEASFLLVCRFDNVAINQISVHFIAVFAFHENRIFNKERYVFFVSVKVSRSILISRTCKVQYSAMWLCCLSCLT